MKKTPLFDQHVALGAKMVPFAGYEMPLKYSTISEEHMAVRESAGIFDVSHMGQFIIKGKQALQLIQILSSNDASVLKIGEAQYSCLMNANGGIVDDMIVYRLDEDQCSEGEQAFMLVVNASNIEKDLAWINANNNLETKVINISDKTGLLAIQGPKSKEILQTLTELDLDSIQFYHFQKGTFAGIDNVLISATGYTGAGGFELYVLESQLANLWEKINEAGKSSGLTPVGLGARDTLRLEMGYCLYGNDIDDEISPAHAGLNWITKPDKNPSFVGVEHYTAAKKDKNRQTLIGILMDGKRIPRKGYKIFDLEDNEIGEVTSGALSPVLDQPIGMGYVPRSFRHPETKIQIQMGKKMQLAKVIKMPAV